jgi:hypothetical protein
LIPLRLQPTLVWWYLKKPAHPSSFHIFPDSPSEAEGDKDVTGRRLGGPVRIFWNLIGPGPGEKTNRLEFFIIIISFWVTIKLIMNYEFVK